MDGLIIRKKWLDLIFQGKKDMELRSTNCKKIERVALIESGSGLIYGDAFIFSSILIKNKLEFVFYEGRHQYKKDFSELKRQFGYTKIYGWTLQSVFKYPKPIPYKHPQGAVIWVKDVL